MCGLEEFGIDIWFYVLYCLIILRWVYKWRCATSWTSYFAPFEWFFSHVWSVIKRCLEHFSFREFQGETSDSSRLRLGSTEDRLHPQFFLIPLIQENWLKKHMVGSILQAAIHFSHPKEKMLYVITLVRVFEFNQCHIDIHWRCTCTQVTSVSIWPNLTTFWGPNPICVGKNMSDNNNSNLIFLFPQ